MMLEMRQKEKRIYHRKAPDLRPLFYGAFESPIGSLYVAIDGTKVTALSFTSRDEEEFCMEVSHLTSRPLQYSDKSVRGLVSELHEYFEGKRKQFSFSPDLSGFTEFQKTVLNTAASIPYGQTRSYKWLADEAGSPRAARAVGQVMARNPVPIIIPCHRVLGSSGGLCGFAGGLRALDLKRKLLAIEGVRVQ